MIVLMEKWLLEGESAIFPALKSSITQENNSPLAMPLYSPKRDSLACHNNNGSPTSPLPPSLLSATTEIDLHRAGWNDMGLDFVPYQATPPKHRSSIDLEDLELFESPTVLGLMWRQPARSFGRPRLQDILDAQRAFGDGKVGLETEAEGYEPGEWLRTMDGELEEMENSSQNSKKSDRLDPITNHIENVGTMSPVKTPSSRTESESSQALSQSAQEPLMAFLDIFEENSMLQDSQLVIDVDD